MTEKFLTLQQVADRLGINDRTIYNWIKNGTFSAFKIGHQWRVEPEEFDRWLQEKKTN